MGRGERWSQGKWGGAKEKREERRKITNDGASPDNKHSFRVITVVYHYCVILLKTYNLCFIFEISRQKKILPKLLKLCLQPLVIYYLLPIHFLMYFNLESNFYTNTAKVWVCRGVSKSTFTHLCVWLARGAAGVFFFSILYTFHSLSQLGHRC